MGQSRYRESSKSGLEKEKAHRFAHRRSTGSSNRKVSSSVINHSALLIERRLASLKTASRDVPEPQATSHKVQTDDGQYIQTRPEVRLSAAADDLKVPLTAEAVPRVDLTPLTSVSATTVISPDDVPLATHLFTIFTDPIDHQISTVAEVLSNANFPNKFRVKARVKTIHPRGLSGKESFVQRHCGHCKRA